MMNLPDPGGSPDSRILPVRPVRGGAQAVYALAQHVADPMRGEAVNIGVIVQMPALPGGVYARFIGEVDGVLTGDGALGFNRAYPEWVAFWRRAMEKGAKVRGGKTVSPDDEEFLFTLARNVGDNGSYRLGQFGYIVENVVASDVPAIMDFLFGRLVQPVPPADLHRGIGLLAFSV